MLAALEQFLADNHDTVLITIAGVKGSTPRETDAWMVVSSDQQLGTIGGGQLEFLAIDHARAMLSGKADGASLDIPLGPEIGQCCGGRVEIAFQVVDDAVASALRVRVSAEDNSRPHVYVFGAGHTGKALLAALSLLPVKPFAVETRAEEIRDLPEAVAAKLVAVPESLIKDIPSGSAVVILTHDHALDFLIASEALKRHDLAYVGMIGSATKRATFANWVKRELGDTTDINRLVLPIGGGTRDKRPAVIAALAAAEIMAAVVRFQEENSVESPINNR